MRHVAAALLCVVGCGGEAARLEAPPAPPAGPVAGAPLEARLALAIEAGDLDAALATLCDAYAAAGIGCSEAVYIEPLGEKEVMARSGVLQNITMPPVPRPGGGLAYWDNWSAILSGGAWQPRSFFTDDEDARRVASMLLVTVLAHELGHHVASRHGCSRPGPTGELLADELSVPLVASLTRGELAPLHARMRRAADAMIVAVPPEQRVEVPPAGDARAWIASQQQLPKAVPSYVALHLSRQRRLLEEGASLAPAAQRLCLEGLATRLASRALRGGGRVRTLSRSIPQQGVTDLLAIDPSARVWSATIGPHLVIRRLDAAAPPIEVELPPDGSDVVAFAAASAERFAVADYAHVWVVERGAIREVGRVAAMPAALAFDAGGALFVAVEDDGAGTWRVETVGAIAESARAVLSVPLGTEPWADGALDVARASPAGFAMRGGGVVFADRAREAVRIATPLGASSRVKTLAGSISGRRDGPVEQATFFGIDAIGALDGGAVAVAETDFARQTLVLRVIEP